MPDERQIRGPDSFFGLLKLACDMLDAMPEDDRRAQLAELAKWKTGAEPLVLAVYKNRLRSRAEAWMSAETYRFLDEHGGITIGDIEDHVGVAKFAGYTVKVGDVPDRSIEMRPASG